MSGSNTFGGTIRLEGEKEYRSAISQINSDLRVFSSELGKLSAEFGRNGQSTVTLTAKNKILAKQIEKQSEKVKTLADAVENVGQKYGENSQKTNDWRTKLNKAEAQLLRLENELESNTEQIKKNKDEVEKSQTPLQKLNDTYTQQQKKLAELKEKYSNIILEQGKNSTEARTLAQNIKSLNEDIGENKDRLKETEIATDDFSDDMWELGKETDNTAEKTNIFGEVLKANLVSDAIKSGLKSIVDGIKSVANAVSDVILKPGFDRAMNIEKAQFKLKGLGHDAQAVENIMKNALSSVKGTAYGLDDAVTVAASAVAAGVEPGKNLERTLKLVADASAIAGSDLSEMGNIFNKVATAQKISAKEINQLNERGIPIAQLLAETMNIATSEVSKLVKKGEIGFAEFEAAIERGMGGAALTMGQTFEGASENVKAAFSRMGAGIMTPFTTALTPALGIVNGIIDDVAAGTLENMETKTNQLGEILKTAVANLLSNFAPILQSLISVFDQILPVIASVLPDVLKIGSEVITNLVNGIVAAMPEITAPTVDIILALSTALINSLPQIIEAAIQIIVSLAKGLTDALPSLIPPIIDAVVLIAESLIENIDLIIEAGVGLLMGLVQAIPQIVSILTPKVPEIIASIVDTLIENIPILLDAAIQLFGALVQAIPPITAVLIENMPQILGALVDGLKRLPELWGAEFNVVLENLKSWFGVAISTAIAKTTEFVNGIINFFKELPGKIWEWLQNTFNPVIGFITENWQALLLMLVNPFAGAFKLIYDNCEAFKNFVNSFINSIKEFFMSSWNSVASFFTETIPAFIESVVEWFKLLPYNLGFLIGQAIGHVIKFGLDLWNFATVTVPEFMSQVITFFQNYLVKFGLGY